MSHGHGESASVAQLLLELVLPGTASGGVAASCVGQDEDMLCLRIGASSLWLPPIPNGGGRESGGFMGDTDEHGAAVGLEVIDSIPNRHASGL